MADCNFGDVLCGAGNLVGGAVGTAVGSGAQDFGQAMMGAWDSLMKNFLTSWLNVGILVDLQQGSVPWLTNELRVFSLFFAVVGIMVACIWTMVHARGDKAIAVSKSLFRVFLVTTVGTVLVQLVLVIGDQFSTWVLDSAGVTVDGYGALGAAGSGSGPLTAGIAIIAGIFGIVATLIQWCIMLIRAVLLPLLVAVWPVAAAASMIQGAEGAFQKITKWLIAFTLYKPVAAIVYAFAWKLKSGGDGIGGVINGLLLLVLAVMALPAMMKLISPDVGALGGASGGGAAMAGGAAVVSAGVAVGAAVVTGGASAGASAGAATAGSGAATAGGGAATAGGGVSAANAAPSVAGSGAASGGPAGANGSSGSQGSAGASGPAGSTSPDGLSGGRGGDSSGGSAGGSSRGGAGLRAGAESFGGSIADGAKDSDGKDVVGE